MPVRTVNKDSTVMMASVGGPIVPSSSPALVIPYLTIGAIHGLDSILSVYGNVHITAAVFGIVGLDAGASLRLVRQDGPVPELVAGLRSIMFVGFGSAVDARVYPNASLTASWEIAERTLLYVGSNATTQWRPGKLFHSPFVGLQIPISATAYIQPEIIWQGAGTNTSSGVFKGESSIGGTGSIGVFIGGGISL